MTIIGMVVNSEVLPAKICTKLDKKIIQEVFVTCEEADWRLVGHVYWAVAEGASRVVVLIT